MADGTIKRDQVIDPNLKKGIDEVTSSLKKMLDEYTNFIKSINTSAKEIGNQVKSINDLSKEQNNGIIIAERANQESEKTRILTTKLIIEEEKLARAKIQTEKAASQLEAQTEKLNTAKKRGAEATNTWGKALDSFQAKFNIIGNLIGGLMIQALGRLWDATKAVIGANIEFDKSLKSLQSITGATADDIKYYTEQAKIMSSQSTQTATDVIKAYEAIGSAIPELLKNKEALAEVTKQSIILSEASGGKMGVAESANAVTAAMNQFNLGAKEASRVINVLAAGELEGSANTMELAGALKNVGTVAATSNMSLEDTVAALEVLAEKQLKGEEAGTKLRGSITKLKEASLGYESGTFNLTDALNEANKQLAKLGTDSEKDAYIIEKFGLENQTVGTILLQNVETLGKLTKAVTGTTTALDQQKIQNESVSAQWTKLKNEITNTFMGPEVSMALGGFVKGLRYVWVVAKEILMGVALVGDVIIDNVINVGVAFNKLIGKQSEWSNRAGSDLKKMKDMWTDMDGKINDTTKDIVDNTKIINENEMAAKKAAQAKLTAEKTAEEAAKKAAKELKEKEKAAREAEKAEEKLKDAELIKLKIQQDAISDNLELFKKAKEDEKIELQVALEAAIKTYNSDVNASRLKEEEKRNLLRNTKKVLTTIEEENQKDIEKSAREFIENTKDAYEKRLDNFSKTSQDITKVDFDEKVKLLRSELNSQRNIINSSKATAEAKKKALQDVDKLEEKLEKESLDRAKADKKAKEDLNNKLYENSKQVLVNGFNLFMQLEQNKITQLESNQIRQFTLLDEEYTRRVAAGEDEKAVRADIDAKKLEIEHQTAIEKAKIQRKQAIVDKAVSMFEIGVNTARASIEAMPNVVLSGLIIAAGVLAEAAVAAKPLPEIPSFKKGTKNAPGGLSVLHGGELVTLPSGKKYLTLGGVDDPILTMLPKHSEVTPNDVLKERILKMPKNDESMSNYLLQQIAGELKKDKPSLHINADSDGLGIFAVSQQGRVNYINKRYRGIR